MTGLELTIAGQREKLTGLAEVNKALRVYGSYVAPLDFHDAPDEIRELLKQPTLSAEESARVRDHFLLSREELLKFIAKAGRAPQVAGGGELSTTDTTNGFTYPQLYVADPTVDYSRFDRYHRNVARDGTAVDEVMQMLSGGGFRLLQKHPGQADIELRLDCIREGTGWLLTHTGAHPHIGSMSSAMAGTKVLGQVIGPAEWEMHYVDA